MRIHRTVIMNPVEPQMMSFRAPSMMQMNVDIQYLDFFGNVLTDDVAGQMQLTSKTQGSLVTYAAPATDVINGKASVLIPAGDLSDMNGYRLRLLGTYKQQPALFAVGSVSLVAAAGVDAYPANVIDNVPVSLVYGLDASITVRLWADAGKSAPFDLTTTTVSAAIYPDSNTVVPLANFTVTPTSNPGEVVLTLPAATVNTLPPSCWWSLYASSATGLTTLAEGTVTITGTIS